MKWMWRSSIARSVLGGFLAFMIPVLLFSIVMNERSVKIARSEIEASYRQSIVLLARQMDDRVNIMSATVNSLFLNSNILYLNYKEDVDTEQLFAYASLVDQLKFYADTTLLQGEIRVYLQNKGKSFSSTTGYGDITKADHREALDLDMQWTGRWRIDDDGLVFVRNPRIKRNNDGVAALARIDEQEVGKFLNHLSSSARGGSLFLIDSDGNRIFSRNRGPADADKLLRKLNEQGGQGDSFLFSSGGVKYRVIYGKSASSGLTIGMYYSEAYATRTLTGNIGLTAAFAVMTALLAFLFTWIFYSRLLKPFRTLAEGMRQVGKGLFGTRLARAPDRDFGFVFRQFNKMANDTEMLINEVYVERLNNQNSQLQLLQSRINPHFLYNCLNFIYQVSMGEDHESAAKMASHLGKYFRDIAKGYRETITLREECDNIETLLKIQNLRFGGRIEYRREIPDDQMERQVPSLIVQPLVENALLHGWKPGQEKLLVRVVAGVDNGRFFIAVEDDGLGMPSERLDEIRSTLRTFEAGNQAGGGIGLNNTYWRLKLKYGEQADLRLENRRTGGLRVTLVMEAEPEMEDRDV